MGSNEGKSKLVTMTPVVDTAIYASADQLGSLVELTNAMDDSSGTGTIVSVTVLDKAAQSSTATLLIFNDKPVVASVDNAALNISDAEMSSKCVGVIPIPTASFVALSASSAMAVLNVQLLVNSVKSADNAGGRSLWAILRSGGTPTYTSTSDLTIKIGIRQD